MYKIIVLGRVQGVRYRYLVKSIADKMYIFGEVKNLHNGSVEIIVNINDEIKLDKFCKIIKQGSYLSKVNEIKIVKINEDITDNKIYIDFKIMKDYNFLQDQKKSIFNLIKNIFTKNKIEQFDLNLIKNLPKHIAIIPDGNRRWAKYNNLASISGHRHGFERCKEYLDILKVKGIDNLTLWAFSTENWNRDESEIKELMNLFLKAVNDFGCICVENKIKFKHLGRKDRLTKELIDKINDLEEQTKKFEQKNLNLAIDYGGRDEIVRAVNKILKTYKKEINQEIDEVIFSEFLDTAYISDPDLIIRTSGEERLSGFLPFQAIYAEIYFSTIYLPDFTFIDLQKAILDYSLRKRRYGK